MVRDIWFGKWLEITRFATMKENLGGYELAAAMRGKRATPTPFSAPGTVTRVEYDAVSSMPAPSRRRTRNSGRGNDVATVSTLEATSDATETTTKLLAEMRAVNAAQMREITELVAAATDGNTPTLPRKEGQAQA